VERWNWFKQSAEQVVTVSPESSPADSTFLFDILKRTKRGRSIDLPRFLFFARHRFTRLRPGLGPELLITLGGPARMAGSRSDRMFHHPCAVRESAFCFIVS
jgi:hypothetical protein